MGFYAIHLHLTLNLHFLVTGIQYGYYFSFSFFNFTCMYVHCIQRRNLRIVYDAIGTLADAVGQELNQVILFS